MYTFKKKLSYARSFSAFIFSTFYDKPIRSLLILRIQAGSSSTDVCLNMFYISAPYPLKERRAKNPGVSLWILSNSLFGPMTFKNSDLKNLCRTDFHGGENFNEVNPDFFFFFCIFVPRILLLWLSGIFFFVCFFFFGFF